jgi:hypothetical protein
MPKSVILPITLDIIPRLELLPRFLHSAPESSAAKRGCINVMIVSDEEDWDEEESLNNANSVEGENDSDKDDRQVKR